jgi:hypothetical protein
MQPALIQLPDDASQVGCQRHPANPYEFEAIYESASKAFRGTEREFLNAGLAYEYIQVDKHKRSVIPASKHDDQSNPSHGAHLRGQECIRDASFHEI